jgi:serine/threonine protein kinase
LVAVCFTTKPHMMCLEFMPGGDLRQYLRNHATELEQHDEEERDVLLSVCLQVARAMAYLEQRRVLHRDLAARLDVLVS